MEVKIEQMIGQGNTAEIYRLDNNKILKLFRHGLDKEMIEKEYENGIIIHKILKCVPKVYDIVEIDGRYGIIYEEIHGRDMLKIMISSLWKLKEFAKKLAQYHLSIQKPVMNNLSSVKEKLEADLNSVEILSDESKEVILNYLKKLPEGNELCHFDFHPGNIMITDNNYIILDWMTACRGDSSADVARTCLILKYGEVPHAPWIIRTIISILQKRIYKIYIREYLTISRKSLEDISCWELPIAAARLREWITENEKRKLHKLIYKHCNK